MCLFFNCLCIYYSMLLKQLNKKNVSPTGHVNGCVTSLIFLFMDDMKRKLGLFAPVEQAQLQ